MPTPIGHALMGGILHQGTKTTKWDWKQFILIVIVANSADLDYLPGFFRGSPNLYHHGPSHSILAAFLVGLVIALMVKFVKKRDFWSAFVIYTSAYFSHVVLDYFAMDTKLPYGVPLFWPFISQYFISPIQIFSDIYKGSTNVTFLMSVFETHNLIAIAIEIGILGPVWGFIFWIRRKLELAEINWQKHGRKKQN